MVQRGGAQATANGLVNGFTHKRACYRRASIAVRTHSAHVNERPRAHASGLCARVRFANACCTRIIIVIIIWAHASEQTIPGTDTAEHVYMSVCVCRLETHSLAAYAKCAFLPAEITTTAKQYQAPGAHAHARQARFVPTCVCASRAAAVRSR